MPITKGRTWAVQAQKSLKIGMTDKVCKEKIRASATLSEPGHTIKFEDPKTVVTITHKTNTKSGKCNEVWDIVTV